MYISQVSGERLQDHWSFGSTFKKPTMNGDSSEYTKVASIYDYEIVIDESKLGDGKPTIDDGITPTDDGKTHLADGQMHLKSNSAGHVVENSIAGTKRLLVNFNCHQHPNFISMWFPNRSDTNRSMQSEKLARSLKVWI